MTGFGGGSGVSWTICKQSAPRSRQKTTPTPHRGLDFKVNLTLENWNESLQY